MKIMKKTLMQENTSPLKTTQGKEIKNNYCKDTNISCTSTSWEHF